MSKDKSKASEKEQKEKEKEKNEEIDKASRVVYIFGRLDNDVAVPVIRRLLRLADRDPKKPIDLYINSSGGNGYNADAIIAVMHSIEPKVNTICLGHALSGACEILASGTGSREAYEFSTLMFHQTIWEAEGDITNLEIQAEQGRRFREAQVELLHRCTGQSRERLRTDIERDHYMNPDEAVKYGIIDKVIKHRSNKPKNKPAHAGRKTAGTSARKAVSKTVKSSTSSRTTKPARKK